MPLHEYVDTAPVEVLYEFTFPLSGDPDWELLLQLCARQSSVRVYYRAEHRFPWPNPKGIFIPPKEQRHTYLHRVVLNYLRTYMDQRDPRQAFFLDVFGEKMQFLDDLPDAVRLINSHDSSA